ncbi:glutathione S-transferase domain-containing protein [Boeremia exigua]|uniref:glutathione S-transferase domain-containing protein n=1 Tax=Boeremia exigua TaxID=749465 RepID=UPI001E8DD552|nr:glutathione S-transferase domain-containing protein [Boeremia exigua]KAH6625875.1 glutathione S-transferase domain-containing protein [Boeremia exigua]
MATPPLTLISATPSPFARMPRILLALKHIPFTLQSEIPWHASTATPAHNPLEKLPVLLHPPHAPVYESAHIVSYIVETFADTGPRLVPADTRGSLKARQVVALAVGCMDAMVLLRFEGRRAEEARSAPWTARQQRKVEGALGAFDGYVRDAAAGGREFVVGTELSIADVGIVCAVGFVQFGGMREGWRDAYGALAAYFDRIDAGEAFVETRPVAFELTERVV